MKVQNSLFMPNGQKSSITISNFSTTDYTEPFHLIYSDVWGPSFVTSTNGFKIYISFVDAHFRYILNYIIKSKIQSISSVQNFKT